MDVMLTQFSRSTVIAAVDMGPILDALGYAIYGALAIAFGYGVYSVVVLIRRVTQKSFPGRESAELFLDEVGSQLEASNFEGALEICDTPELWSRAIPQLVSVGIENRNKPIRKIRQMLGEFYEREIVSEFDARLAWVNTIVKSAPMLGLLGTVTGMIGAFKKIASATGGIDPAELAGNISLALLTTACGLATAIPLVILTNVANVRISRLQDSVDEVMGVVMDDLEAAQVRAGLQGKPRSRS